MAELSQQELNKKIKSLPQDLQDAFFSEKVSETILEIGKKFGLRIDKVGELGDETSSVMIGLTPPKDYIKNLAVRLEMDPIKTREIAEEVNKKVFQPVRESLKRLHGLAEEKKEPPAVSNIEPRVVSRVEPKPEIIKPSVTRIAIKTDREEMDRIEIPESIPGMVYINKEASVFVKKIDLEKPKVEPPVVSKTESAPLPKIPTPPIPPATQTPNLQPPISLGTKKPTPIDELLDKIDGASVKSEIEKVLGGKIRPGTASPL